MFPPELVPSVPDRGGEVGGAFLADRATRLRGSSGLALVVGRFLVRVLLRREPAGDALALEDDSPVTPGAVSV